MREFLAAVVLALLVTGVTWMTTPFRTPVHVAVATIPAPPPPIAVVAPVEVPPPAAPEVAALDGFQCSHNQWERGECEPQTEVVAPPPAPKPVLVSVPLPRPRPAFTAPPKPHASLIERARKYLGKNPTGWAHVWCGKFMALIAPEAARKVRNPNEARSWASLPKADMKPGAIAVLRRSGGGHIGIITEVKRDRLVIISGNHGHVVGIGSYPKSRVIKIVSAT